MMYKLHRIATFVTLIFLLFTSAAPAQAILPRAQASPDAPTDVPVVVVEENEDYTSPVEGSIYYRPVGLPDEPTIKIVGPTPSPGWLVPDGDYIYWVIYQQGI